MKADEPGGSAGDQQSTDSELTGDDLLIFLNRNDPGQDQFHRQSTCASEFTRKTA